MIIVKQTLLSQAGVILRGEAWVLFNGEVFRQPVFDGGDTNVVFIELSIDHGEQSGIGHGSVATEDLAAIGASPVAGFRVAREVVEGPVVTCFGQVVGFFEVLRARDELNGGFPIEFRLLA